MTARCPWREHDFRLIFQNPHITVRECRKCGTRDLKEAS